MHTPRLFFRAVVLAIAALVPLAAAAQPDAVDLTSRFVKAGVHIDGLKVYAISGIIVLRGSTNNKAESAKALRFAKDLGYRRVANLIQTIPSIDDAAIMRSIERQLSMQRGLDGCKFQIESKQGVVHLRGRIHEDMQKDMAIDTVRRIDGVREVHAELTRS